MTKLFVALDLETTGLDPKNDRILEIAWVVCDQSLNALTPRRSFIVDHGEDWGDVFSLIRSNEAVRRMHQDSGLAGELLSEDGVRMEDISDVLFADILNCSLSASIHLLGASIGFDRSFLQADLNFTRFFSEDDGLFHHRLYDLSSVKLAYEVAGLVPPKIENKSKHRALDDVDEVLEFARAVKQDFSHMEAGL